MSNEYHIIMHDLSSLGRNGPQTSSLSYTSYTSLDDIIFRLTSAGIQGESQALFQLALGMQLLNSVMPHFHEQPQLMNLFSALVEEKSSIKGKSADIRVRRRDLATPCNSARHTAERGEP